MTLCQDTFEAMRADTHLAPDADAQKALEAARALLTHVKLRVLPDMPDALTRQMGGILFSHAASTLDKNLCLLEPEIWEESGGAPKKAPVYGFAGAGILMALCGLTLWNDKAYLLAAASFAALVLMSAGFWLQKKAREKKRQRVILRVDWESLMDLLAGQMLLIDRDLEALASLMPDGAAGEVSDSALDALMKVYEVQSREKWPHPEIRQAVEHFFNLNGILEVAYTSHNAPLFQTLPTKGASRTLIPALIKNNVLIRQGLAVTTKEAAE